MVRDFEELIYKWEENEIIYKELYLIRARSEEEYLEYIKKLDYDEMMSRGLYIPGLTKPFNKFEEYSEIFNLNTDIAVWKHSRYTPPYIHSHNYFEIICVLDGIIKHRIEGREDVLEMKKGDICILPNDVKHSVEAMNDDCIVINIMLKKRVFEYTFFDVLASDNILSQFFHDALSREDNRYNYLLFHTIKDDTNIIKNCIIEMFLEYYNHKRYYDKALISLTNYLFVILLRNYEQFYEQLNANKKELEIIQYIKLNYADITLESAAEYFNYSEAYFSRMIKKLTGKKFSELVMTYRFNIACRLLKESNLLVSEISEIVGYKSLEHFNRQFKKVLKKTPTQYRNEYYQS